MTYRCPHCKDGFFWDEIGLDCLPCPARCTKCTSGSDCLKCNDFLEFINGMCKENNGIDFCVHANPQNKSLCMQCHHGYTLSPNKRECIRCFDDNNLFGCRFCQINRLNNQVAECLECIDNMELVDGYCEFNSCVGNIIANFYPDTTYNLQPFGQLLQAAICENNDCDDNYGAFHVGCKQCTVEGKELDWEFCLDCDFKSNGNMDECTECSEGWELRKDGQGCQRIPIKNCDQPTHDNLECFKCKDTFSWNDEDNECSPCLIDKCNQCSQITDPYTYIFLPIDEPETIPYLSNCTQCQEGYVFTELEWDPAREFVLQAC